MTNFLISTIGNVQNMNQNMHPDVRVLRVNVSVHGPGFKKKYMRSMIVVSFGAL